MTEGSGYGPYPYGDTPPGPGYGTGHGGGYGGGYGYGGFPPPPPPRRRGGGVLSHLAVAVLAVAVGVGATLGLYSPGSNSSASGVFTPGAGAVPAPGSSSGSAPNGGTSATGEQAVVNKVTPGTVLINSTLQYSSEAGAGTGMIINSDGLVLTNNHVIEDSTRLSATVVSTGKTYPAKVVGYDKTGDVALIQLQGASGLHTVPLGNSSTVKTGTPVVALGNAEGQGSLIPAAGTIIGTGKTITATDQGGSITSETLHNMLKTNANIVSGDSGGPLSDAAGQVIGMDTAGNSVSEGTQTNSGFAIPINTALSIARQIAAGHASSTISIGYPAFIGIFIASGTNGNPQSQAQQQEQSGGGNPFGGGFGGPGGNGGSGQSCYTSNADLQIPTQIAQVNSGTLVDGVICGSPAAAAGMTGGAVITAVNGQSAGSPNHLGTVLAKLKPGQTVSLTWVSPSGQRSTSSLHLVAGPPQ
ncbi:MAG TPA: trypsin-like peptidase domain-containing protein [Trebonia sp.]|jgi:S1-C subfamily serine protease|nr:trypsin-like peptidase domain-containing protein [Trebonia sp.]